MRKIESRIDGKNSNSAIRFTPKSTGPLSMPLTFDVVIESYPDIKFKHNILLVGLDNIINSLGWDIEKTSCRHEKWVGDLAIRATVEGIGT